MRKSFPENQNKDPDIGHPGSNSTRTGEDLPIISAPADQLPSDEQVRSNAAQRPTNVPTSPAPASSTDQRSENVDDNFLDVSGARNCAPGLGEPPPPPLPPPPDSQHVVEASSGPSLRCLSDSDLFPEQGSSLQHFRSGTSLLSDRRLSLQSYTMSSRGNQPADAPGNFPTPPEATTADGVGPRDTPRAEEEALSGAPPELQPWFRDESSEPRQPPRKHVGLKGLLNTGASSVSRITYTISPSKSSQSVAEATSPPPEESLGRQPSEFATRDHFVSHSGSLETMTLLNEWPLLKKQSTEPRTTSSAAPLVSQGPSSVTLQQQINMDVMLNPSKTDAAENRNAPHEKRLDVPKARAKSALDVRSEYDPEERPAQVAKKTRSVNLENVKEEDIIELVRFINAAFASQKSVSGTTTHSQALPCPEKQSDFIRRVDSAETSTTEEAAQIPHITNYEKVKDVWSSALLTEEFILGRQQPPQLFPVIVADKSLTKLKTEKDLAPQQVIQVKGTRVKRGSQSYDVIIKFPSMEVLLRKPSADKPKEVIYGAERKGSVSEKENQASASSWLGEFFTAADAPRVGSTIEKFKQGHEAILPLTETEAGSQAGATKSSKGEPAIQSNTALEFDRDEMLPFFEENAPFFYSNMEHGKNKNELQQQKAPKKSSEEKKIAPRIIQSAKIGVETAEPDRKIELPKPQYQERIPLQVDSGTARAGEKETLLSIEMLQQVEVKELAAHARTVITTASTKDCRIQVAAGLHLDIPDVQIPGQKRQDQNLQVSDGTLPAVVFPLEVAEQAKQLKVTPVSEEAPEMSLEIPALKHPVEEIPEVDFPAGEECFPDGIRDIQGKELEARMPVEGPLNVASDAISGAILPSIIREELPSSLGTSGEIEEQNIIEEISEPLPDNTKLFVKMTITPVVSDVDFVPRTSQDLSKEVLEYVPETHQRPMPSEFSTVISENTVTEGESKTEDQENTMKYTELPTKVLAPKFVPDTHQGPLPSEYYAEQSETTVLHGKTKTQMPETEIKYRKPSTEVPAPEPISETHQEHMPSEYYAGPSEVTVLQEEVKTEDQQTTKEVPAPETFPETQPELVPSEYYAERNKDTLLLGEPVTEDQETTREVRGSEPVSETDQEPMPSEYYVGPSEVTVLQEDVKTEDQQTTIEVPAPETFPETQPERMPLEYHAEQNKDTLLPGEAVTKDQETTREVRGSEPVSETDQEPMPSEYYVGPSEVTVLQEEIKTEDQQTTIEVPARETFPETQPERMPLEYYAEQNKDTLLLGEAVTEDQETTREVRGSEPVSETDQEPMPSEYYVVPSEVTVLQEEVKTEDQQTTIEVPAPETFPETQPEHVPSQYYAERNKDTLLLGEAVTEDQETTREVRGSEPVSETDQEPMPSEYYVGPSEVTVLQEEVKTEDQQTTIEVQAPETFPETQPERMPLEYYAERNKDTVLLGEAITKDQETREVPAPKPIPEIHQEPMPSEFYAGPSEVTVLQEEVKVEDQQTTIEVPAPETFPETQPEHVPSEYYAERNKDTLLLGEAMIEDQETTREVRGSEPVSDTHQEPMPSEYYVGPSEVTVLQEEVKTEDQQTTIEVPAPETFLETQPEHMPLEYHAERNKDTLLLGEAMAEDQETTRELRGSEPVSETHQEPMPSEYYVGPSEATALQEEVKTEDQQTTIEVPAPETFPETKPERMPLEYYAERNKDTLLLGEAMTEDQETTREVQGSEPVSETHQEPIPSEYYVGPSEVTVLQEEVKTEDQQTTIKVSAPEPFLETQPESVQSEYYTWPCEVTVLQVEAMTEDQQTTRELRAPEPVPGTHQEPMPSEYYTWPNNVTMLQGEAKTEDQPTRIEVQAAEHFPEIHPEPMSSEYFAGSSEVTVAPMPSKYYAECTEVSLPGKAVKKKGNLLFVAEREVPRKKIQYKKVPEELSTAEVVPKQCVEPMLSEYYVAPTKTTFPEEAVKEKAILPFEAECKVPGKEVRDKEVPQELSTAEVVPEHHVEPMPSEYYAAPTEIPLLEEAVKEKINLPFEAEREVQREELQYEEVPQELSTADVVSDQHVEPMPSEYYATPPEIPPPEEAAKEETILPFGAECEVPGKEVQYKEVPQEPSTAEVVPEHHVEPMPSEYYAAPTEILLLEEAVKEKTILPFEAEREVQRKELQYEEVPQELSTADIVSDQHVEPMPSEYYATPPEIPPPEEAAKKETILPFGAECEVPGKEVKYKEVPQEPSTAEVVPEHHVEPMPSEYYAAPTEILLLEEAVKKKTILPFEAEREVQRKELQYEEVPQELSTADIVSDQHVEPMPSEYYATPPEIPPPEAAKEETILPFGAECEVPGKEVQYKEVPQEPSTAEVVPEQLVEPMPSEYWAAHIEIPFPAEAVKVKEILQIKAQTEVLEKEVHQTDLLSELPAAEVVPENAEELIPSEYSTAPAGTPIQMEEIKYKILPFQKKEPEVPVEKVQYEKLPSELFSDEASFEQYEEHTTSVCYAAPCEIPLEDIEKEKDILIPTAVYALEQYDEHMPSEHSAAAAEILLPVDAVKESIPPITEVELQVPDEELEYKELPSEVPAADIVLEQYAEPMPPEYYATAVDIYYPETVKEKKILPLDAEPAVTEKGMPYNEVPSQLPSTEAVLKTFVDSMPSDYNATRTGITLPEERLNGKEIFPVEGTEREISGEKALYAALSSELPTIETVLEQCVEPIPSEYYATPKEIRLPVALEENEILSFEATPKIPTDELQEKGLLSELTAVEDVLERYTEPMPSEYYYIPAEVLPMKPIKDEIVPFLASKSDVPRKEIEYKELSLKLSAAQDVLEQFIEPMPSEYYAASIESPYPNKTQTDKEILISEAEPETLVKELQCKQVASEVPMANMPPTDVLAKEKEMSLIEDPRPYKPGEGVKYEKLHSASESAKLDAKEDLEFLPPQLIAACSEISPLPLTSVDVDESASETDAVSVEALKRGSAEVLKYLKFIDKMVTVEPLPEEALISVKAEFDQLSFLPDQSDFSKEAQERPKLSSSENDINLPVPLGIVTRRILRETTVTEEFQKLFPLQPGILCSSYQGKVDESGGPRLQPWEPTELFDVITTRKETKTKEKVEYTEPYKNEDFDTTEISLDNGSVSRGASDEYHTKTIVLQCNKEEEVKYAEPLSSFCSCVPEELGTEVSNTATRNECVVHTEDTTGTCDRFHEEYLTRAAKKATVVKETFQVIKPLKFSKRALSSTKEECLPGTSQDTKQGNKLTKALSKSIVLIELREDTRPRKKLSVEADLNKRLMLTGDVPTDEAGKEPHEINVSIDGRAFDKDPSKSSDNFTITQIEQFPGTSLDQGTAPFTEFQDELPSVDELEQRFRPPMGLHRDLLSLHEFDIGAARDHRKHISSMEGGEKTITASSDEPTFPSRIKLIDTPANEHPVEATPIEKDYFPSSDTENHETGKIKQKFHLVAPSVHKGELATLGERSLAIPTSESSVELMQAEKYAIATDISRAETVPASHRQKSLDKEFQSSHAAPAYKLVPEERSLVPVLDIAADGALAEYYVENSHIPAAGTVPAVEPQAFRTEDIQTLTGASVHLAVPGENPVVIPTLQSVVEVMPAEYYSKAVETSIAEAVLAVEPQKPVSQNFEPTCAPLEYKRAIEEESALLLPWRKIVEPMSTERSLQVVEIPSATVLPGEVQQLLDKEVEPSNAGLDEIKVVVPTLEKKAEALPPEPDQKNYEMLGTKMVPETEPHNLVYEEFEPSGYEHTPKDMSTAADLALPTAVESTSTEYYEEVQRMSTMDTLADLEQTRHGEIKGSSEGDAHQGATLPTEISLPVEYYTASSEVSTAEAIAGARREKPSTKEIEPRYAAAEYNVPQVRQELFPGALNVVPGEYLTPSNSSSSGMLVTPEYSDTETMNGVNPMSMRESERRLLEWYPSIEVSHEAPQPSEVMEPLELPWRTLSGPPTKLALLPLQEGIEYASLSSIEYLSEDLLESHRNTDIMSSLADVQSELFMSNGAQEPREDLVAAPLMELGSALCGKRRSSDVSDWLQEASTSQVKELTTHQEQTAVSTLPATSTGVGHIPWTSQLDELASDSTPVDELKSAEVNKTSSREAEPVDALDPAAPAIAFSFALVAFVTAVVVLFDSVPGGTITQQASCTIL